MMMRIKTHTHTHHRHCINMGYRSLSSSSSLWAPKVIFTMNDQEIKNKKKNNVVYQNNKEKKIENKYQS